jgi:hypothetical protein
VVCLLWFIMLLDLNIFYVSKAGLFLESGLEIHLLGLTLVYHDTIRCVFQGFIGLSQLP